MGKIASKFAGIDGKSDTPNRPTVSIITPVLNGIKYLEACITSVLNQNHPNIEHIFVDGGSTDGTLEMLSNYQVKYPDRIRFISEPDQGTGEAWNKGLKMASGQIFGWLGADDMSEPGAISAVVDFFKDNPDAYFVFGECNFINGDGKIIMKSITRGFNLKKIINDANWIPCTSAFYRREVVERVGWFDNFIGSDRDYWIRIGKIFPIHRIERVLSNFRIHEGSATTGSSRNTRLIHIRNDYLITRRHGGSMFSHFGRRYYYWVIVERLRPVLGFSYPLLERILRKRLS